MRCNSANGSFVTRWAHVAVFVFLLPIVPCGELSALQDPVPPPTVAQKEGLEPISLDANDGRHSFHLRASERQLLPQVLEEYGIEAAIDDSVGLRVIPFDVDNVAYADAATLLQLASGTFFVPIEPHRVLVVADTRQNRARYEPKISETLHLAGLSPAELDEFQGAVHEVLAPAARFSQADADGRYLIRGTASELWVVNQMLGELLAGRSELQLEVQVYAVDLSKGSDAGTILPNSATIFNVRSEIDSLEAANSSLIQELISEGLVSAGNYSEILAALLASGALSGTVFNNPFVTFGGGLTQMGAEWNNTTAQMLLTASNAQSLYDARMRVSDG